MIEILLLAPAQSMRTVWRGQLRMRGSKLLSLAACSRLEFTMTAVT